MFNRKEEKENYELKIYSIGEYQINSDYTDEVWDQTVPVTSWCNKIKTAVNSTVWNPRLSIDTCLFL